MDGSIFLSAAGTARFDGAVNGDRRLTNTVAAETQQRGPVVPAAGAHG